jgi:hypothetical protein
LLIRCGRFHARPGDARISCRRGASAGGLSNSSPPSAAVSFLSASFLPLPCVGR